MHTPFQLIVVIFCLFMKTRVMGKSVSTTYGVLRGETVQAETDDLSPVTQYLGVPYGASPSGQYRFNMAISAAKWTHMPKDANRLSSVCIQTLPDLSETKGLQMMSSQRLDHLHKLLPSLKKQSEDCLHMNLFVPERLEKSTGAGNRLPVLVVVHGDEYGWNSGGAYNGTVLASFAQMIVVTLNYRLGFLGRCESASCSGNAGMSDLVAALKMLSNTLPAFGGDPALITLLGWGSGAALISLLMASPLTQPNQRLFKRAILLDGTALAPWAMTNNPQPFFFMLAEKLKCTEGSRPGELREIESIVRCVQDHSADNVTKAAGRLEAPTFLSLFAPIIDGQMVPNRPRTLFGAQFGALFREIDLLVGTVSNPGHFLMSNEDLIKGVDVERRDKILRTLTRNLFTYHRTEILSAISNEYTDWDNPMQHAKTLRNGVLQAIGDVLFTAPMVDTLRLHALDEQFKESSTFFFVFAHSTRAWNNNDASSNGIVGSLTGDHVPYILGYPLLHRHHDDLLYSGFTADDKSISRVVMQMIANFVKSGNPSKPSTVSGQSSPIEQKYASIAWPEYSEASREAYLEISDRPRIKNFYRNAQVGFWNGLVPQLHVAGREGEHHFLPDHFKKESFFGTVRPFSGYSNFPFPPPPLPPTPLPKDLKSKPSSTPTSSTSSETPSTTSTTPTVQYQNSTMLPLTVGIGSAILMLNLCIFLGFYRQCDKQRRRKNKLQLQYQTYASNHQHHHPSVADNYNLHSSSQQQLYALSSEQPPMVDYEPMVNNNFNRHFQAYNGTASLYQMMPPPPPVAFQEQEPLLATIPKTSSAGLRPGVSPTCPRHGRAAMALAAAQRASVISQQQQPLSQSQQPPPSALEEIQV